MVKKVTKWLASDGTLHDTEQEARNAEGFAQHEALLYEAFGSWTRTVAVSKDLWNAGFKLVRRPQ